MRLWTWQHKTFNLADRTQKVRSQQFSVYTTHPQRNSDMKEKHKNAYKKVFERLGTDQLIWCFHEYEEAASRISIEEFEKQDRVLWEIDVPCEKIKWYCDAAWTCLREGKPSLSGQMYQIYLKPDYAKKFEDAFTAYWGAKNDEELLNLMFLNYQENGCSEAMVFHPVDTVTKNPLLLGKWWSEQHPQSTGRVQCDLVPLPCPNCQGRNL